jgi:hypothetical protein
MVAVLDAINDGGELALHSTVHAGAEDLSRPENLAALADLTGTVDRQGASPATTQDRRAGHGFEREPQLW